jgi:outer membrane protein TolC
MKLLLHVFSRSRTGRHAALIGLLLLCSSAGLQAQDQLHVRQLDDLLAYADQHSATSLSGKQEYSLAKLQAFAAKANTINLRGALSYNMTDNYRLPINFIPAEVFGGPAGTFREITLGQQYVQQVALTPTLDLINPGTWARVASARYSTELTSANNRLAQRNLHEQIAGAYYNLRTAEAQVAIARQNLANADSITQIVGNRHAQGLVRKQDLNNAEANRLNLADFVAQLEFKVEQYIYVVRALVGMPEAAVLEMELEDAPSAQGALLAATSTLQTRALQLQVGLQRSELRSQRMGFLPTLSVVASLTRQYNDPGTFFNNATSWVRTNYVGLRLSVPFPTDAAKWSQAESARINLRLSEIKASNAAMQEHYQNAQLEVELDKATQTRATTYAIQALKAENYQASLLNYQEGILSADLLLTAFTDYLNSQLNACAATWAQAYQQTRIHLNASIR